MTGLQKKAHDILNKIDVEVCITCLNAATLKCKKEVQDWPHSKIHQIDVWIWGPLEFF